MKRMNECVNSDIRRAFIAVCRSYNNSLIIIFIIFATGVPMRHQHGPWAEMMQRKGVCRRFKYCRFGSCIFKCIMTAILSAIDDISVFFFVFVFAYARWKKYVFIWRSHKKIYIAHPRIGKFMHTPDDVRDRTYEHKLHIIIRVIAKWTGPHRSFCRQARRICCAEADQF